MVSVLALGRLLPASGQGAERAWTDPVRISAMQSARNITWPPPLAEPWHAADPQVLIGADGRALVGWIRYENPTPLAMVSKYESYAVMAAGDDGHNAWTAPELLASVGSRLYSPELMASWGSAGGATLAWKEAESSGAGPFVRVDGSAGRWTEPVRIEPARSELGTTLEVWHAPQAGAHGAWIENGSLAAATWSADGGWSPAEVLPGDWNRQAQVFDRAGDLHVFLRKPWTDPGYEYMSQDTLFTATWGPGSGWSSVHEFGLAHGDAEIRATAGGELLVVWQLQAKADGSGPSASLRGAVRSAEGEWSPSVELAPARHVLGLGMVRSLSIAAAEDGDAMLLWTTTDGVLTATRPAGGQWSAAVPELPVMQAPFNLVLNERGEAMAAWSTGQIRVSPSGPDAGRTDALGVGCQMEAATRSATGTWSQPHRLAELIACSDFGYGHVSLALNRRGDGALVFRSPDGRHRATVGLAPGTARPCPPDRRTGQAPA